MKTELKIIKSFIENKKTKTIREISQQIKADYRITYIAAKRLIEKKILKVQTVGKSSLCSLNENYFGIAVYEAENERKEEILKNKQTKTSDIDLLFISNESGFETRISDILSLLPLKTHAMAFTEEEFIRMKDTKRSNVIQEAIESNIILYGIEAYYRIKNS